jgi:hypothetical protein
MVPTKKELAVLMAATMIAMGLSVALLLEQKQGPPILAE